MFESFDFQQMISAFIVFFVDDRGLLRRRCPATAFPCGYRIVCSGRFVCYFPVITGNDTRYRNL